MKILHINTHGTGGAAKSCIRLHEGLLSSGIESKILFREKKSIVTPNSYSYYDFIHHQNFFYKLVFYIKRKLYIKTKKQIPKHLEFSDIDTPFKVYDHPLIQWADVINLHWVSGFVDYSFFKQIKKPVVWTMHDMHPFSGGYHYTYETSSFLDNYVSHNQKRIKAYLSESKISFVAPSDWLSEHAQKELNSGNFTFRTIRYGINTKIFKILEKTLARTIFDIPSHKKVFLFVAHSITDKRKGLKILMDAIDGMNHKEEFIFVAAGFQFHDLALTENIRFLGNIKDELLMSILYSASDFLVIPSLEDNFPNTVLESLCCGTPVISFSSGGIPEMISTKNGLICIDKNSASLKNSILESTAINWDNDQISKDARSEYFLESQAANYIFLYTQLLRDGNYTKD